MDDFVQKAGREWVKRLHKEINARILEDIFQAAPPTVSSVNLKNTWWDMAIKPLPPRPMLMMTTTESDSPPPPRILRTSRRIDWQSPKLRSLLAMTRLLTDTHYFVTRNFDQQRVFYGEVKSGRIKMLRAPLKTPRQY